MTDRPLLGLDIGGTKLAAGIATPSGQLLASKERPTGVTDGPHAVIERLVVLAREVTERAGVQLSEVSAAGVACGGPLDPVAGVVTEAPNLHGWVDVPLIEHLERDLGVRAFLENDATAAALGEHRFGAGRGVRNLVYLTISTGIGGGLILDGRPYRGENGNAGEIGHLSVDYRGRQCHCGRRGCLEAEASGTAIAARARDALTSGDGPDSTLRTRGAPELTARTVADAVRSGDALATRVWEEAMRALGEGVASVIDIFNPRLVILGGGVTAAGSLLFEPVRRIALESAWPTLARVVEIVPAQLGRATGVLGAVAVALERLEGEGASAASGRLGRGFRSRPCTARRQPPHRRRWG